MFRPIVTAIHDCCPHSYQRIMLSFMIPLSFIALIDVCSSILPQEAFLSRFDLFLQLSQSCLAQKSGDRLFNDHDSPSFYSSLPQRIRTIGTSCPSTLSYEYISPFFVCMHELFDLPEKKSTPTNHGLGAELSPPDLSWRATW